jgi:acylglycerol lipase
MLGAARFALIRLRRQATVAGAMNPQDRSYKTLDGTDLPLRVWRPDHPRAALVYLHGIQSHSGWYAASSECLARAGVAVYQLERRGSGLDRNHERGHGTRAEVWLDDVTAAADLARGETGIPAVHLLGVSWGGKLALACAGRQPELYRSLMLAAPGILPRIGLPLGRRLHIAGCLLTGRGGRRFPIPLADPALFTANPDRRRYVAEDPLSLREATARFLFESRRLDRLALAAARQVRLPVMLALAEADLIIDNARTRALLEALPSVHRRIVTYPGAHHTLEFEPDPSAYLADLVKWIDEAEAGPRG